MRHLTLFKFLYGYFFLLFVYCFADVEEAMGKFSELKESLQIAESSRIQLSNDVKVKDNEICRLTDLNR